jgi:PII-like signaling protein
VADSEPMVVEIVDNTEKIERFYENMKPYFDKIKNGCLITMEDVQLVLFKHEK